MKAQKPELHPALIPAPKTGMDASSKFCYAILALFLAWAGINIIHAKLVQDSPSRSANIQPKEVSKEDGYAMCRYKGNDREQCKWHLN